MEISKRTVGIVIAFLLIAAASTPFVFFSHYPDYDEAIELSVTYRHHEATYDSNDGWDTQIDETILMTFTVSLSNLSDSLRSETIDAYPLWMDVGSWDIGIGVNIRGYERTVDDNAAYYGHDCWIVAINDDTSVYYSKEWGLLIAKRYSRSNFTEFMEYTQTIREYTLIDSNLEDFDRYYISMDGWLFSAILVQMTLVIAYVYDRRYGEA